MQKDSVDFRESKMIATKVLIFLLMVTPDRNNSILAHRLFFSSFYENHLKLGINDNDPKDTGQEGFDANDANAKKTMDKMKKLMCKIVYPMPCTNLLIKITSFEGTEKTTVKPEQKRLEENNFMFRQMKRWIQTDYGDCHSQNYILLPIKINSISIL